MIHLIQKLLSYFFPFKPGYTDIQRVFMSSKCNGGKYEGDNLPILKWRVK